MIAVRYKYVLAMLAAGDTPAVLLEHYDFLEPDDLRACFLYAALYAAKHGDRPETLTGLLDAR